MDVRQIRDFVAVVRCSSFAAASRALHVSQPGLGYQVKQLEDELRVRLLQRHARGVSLTEAGEAFMDHAEQILAAIDNAKRAMAGLGSKEARKINVGITPSLQALGPLLLSCPYPDTKRIQLKEAYGPDLQQGLIDGSLDVAICLSAGKTPLRSRPIYSEPLFMIGPNSTPVKASMKISVRELSALPLVLSSRSRTSRRLLEDAAAAACVKLAVDQEVDSLALLRSLVLHSGRCTVAPYGIFGNEIENGSLSAWRISDPDVRQVVNAVYHPDLPSSLDSFIEMIIQVIVKGAPLPPDMTNLVLMAAE